MKRYPKMREVIHDGSKPPKLGTYTPPMLCLVEKPNSSNTIISGGQTELTEQRLISLLLTTSSMAAGVPKAGRRRMVLFLRGIN